MTKEDPEKYKKVVDLVKEERKKRGIKDSDLRMHVSTWEPSCIAFGEAYNLVETRLIYTNEKYSDEWKILKENPFLLDLAYNYLQYNSHEGLPPKKNRD